MSLPARARPPGCVTDLVFDRWFANELDPDVEPTVVAHTQRCPRCNDRHAMLAAQRSAFLALRPGFTPAPRLGRRHWGWLLAAALLAAVALAGIAAHA